MYRRDGGSFVLGLDSAVVGIAIDGPWIELAGDVMPGRGTVACRMKILSTQ
jgi:hypothetical protein